MSEVSIPPASNESNSPKVVVAEPPPIALQLGSNESGSVQGSWYRQQMSASKSRPVELPVVAIERGASADTQPDAPSNERNSYLPGSLRNSSREILLRRVVLPATQK
jgi:hypothetical protein